MKEMKGILFKPDMIRAIVEGRKTQTRRVIKIPEDGRIKDGSQFKDGYVMICFDQSGLADWKKQYARYQVGETVYIKETLYRHPYLDEAGYMLDETPVFINQTIGDCLKWRWQKDILTGMFMPQEAARSHIVITDVRTERLQEIAWYDVPKEGIQDDTWSIGKNRFVKKTPERLISDFKHLWDSINKPPFDWKANPWVWVISFKVV